jgi:hypothetical protein
MDRDESPHNVLMIRNRPVAEFAQPVPAIFPEDSIARAARAMRDHDISLVPVVKDGRLVGAFGGVELARALGDDVDLSSPVADFLVPAPSIRRFDSTIQCLRMFDESAVPILMVVDASDVLCGMVTPAMLASDSREPIRPTSVGGMATPFGVYLTTGMVSGGVSKWALMSTGSVMFSLLFLGSLVGTWVDQHVIQNNLTSIPAGIADAIVTGVSLAIFLLGLRVIPLAGTHAAEHQVVHAIERGEELRPEIVRRMPRVHPRCGTNLAAASMLFLGIAGSDWGFDFETRFLVGAVITFLLWRPLGNALQRFVTTRPATVAQLESGIRSGNDLLEKFSHAQEVTPNVFARIWNSGLLQVIAGSSLTYLVVWSIAKLTGWDIPL